MPLVALADHVDGLQELKLSTGYGLPDQYPLGINGLFGLGDEQSPLGPFAFDPKTAFSPPSTVGQPSTQIQFTDYSKFTNPTPGAGTPAGSGSPIDQFFAGAQKLAAALVPAFSGANKRPKQVTVVQKQPDYTTYAVIAGAVVVASVLAIAVGKSGRRGDK